MMTSLVLPFIMKSVFQGCQSGVRSLYATADLLAEVSQFMSNSCNHLNMKS